MPALQTAATHLNNAFRDDNIDQTATNRDAFAPGERLSSAIANFLPEQSRLRKPLASYFDSLPGSLQESIRGTIYYALSTSPPTHITFAWAPSYDFELTTWQAPDTRATRGGITLLIKSRYPADTHPLSRRAPTR
jgi:hypothetical protein